MQPAPRHQQPIFAAKPAVALASADLPLRRADDLELREPADPSRVTPQCIFAAGKRSFNAVVRDVKNAAEAKIVIYADLPLYAEGWVFEGMKVRRVRELSWGTIYLVERTV